MRFNLCREAIEAFLFISDCECWCGSIGIADLIERHEVLSWLADESNGAHDPRNTESSVDENTDNGEQWASDVDGQIREKRQADGEPPIIEFMPLGLSQSWFFTLGDPDNYPSVPHGHLQNQNRPWPKLNPYTGRAFNAKDSEDVRLRLRRKDMVVLWNSQDFRDHALKQIAHYQVTFPHHRFPVPASRVRRLPRWK
jgi:hypothetical protein